MSTDWDKEAGTKLCDRYSSPGAPTAAKLPARSGGAMRGFNDDVSCSWCSLWRRVFGVCLSQSRKGELDARKSFRDGFALNSKREMRRKHCANGTNES